MDGEGSRNENGNFDGCVLRVIFSAHTPPTLTLYVSVGVIRLFLVLSTLMLMISLH